MNIEQLIAQLTVEEKISLLAGASFWTTQAIERLGIPSITLTDGPHGLRLSTGTNPGEMLMQTQPATAFPIEAAMAATWNEALIEEMGAVMAEECQHYDVGILLGPGMNGKRSPLGGRNFEYFSEDPYLTGRMGVAFVKGVQGGGVGASIKHFVANEQETNRMVVSAEVDERTLRELYMLPFEMVVREANPWTVMCAYNQVNGTHMGNHHSYLNGVLKQEWGFDGLVMSDWGAVVDKVASLQSGLDLEMPGPGTRTEEAMEAYRQQRITDEQLDDHVRRVLRTVEKIVTNNREVPAIDVERHHAVARRVAEEAIVLLKNEDALLPLSPHAKVAVLGAFAKEPRFQGGGSSHMNPALLDSPYEEIAKFADAVYSAGYDEAGNAELLEEACELAVGRDAVIVFAGTTEAIESEGYDRADLYIPASHLKLIEAVALVNPNVIVVVNSGSATAVGAYADKVKGIVQAWLPGQAGGSAIANVLFGSVTPSGKLSETFPLWLEHNPSYLSFPGNVRQVHYTEGIFTGYRHYDTRKLDVLYPFGHGLSYTTFEYANLRLSSDVLTNGEVLRIAVDITNTGKYAGQEVVQVYVRDVQAEVARPDKELKGFAKVALLPGETRTVEVQLDERAFAYYAEHLGRFAVEAGAFDILVGASSRDIRLSATIQFASEEDIREPLTLSHALRAWLRDERYAGQVGQVMQYLHMDEKNPMYAIFLGMPIRTIIGFLSSFGYSQEVVGQIEAMFGQSALSSPELRG
ncbi:glycoside hydrolase family 3 C-terminal domain-containing protein [Paenibacillus ferrarius]|uniref:glycoside hydrolase family 3 C-terminal domain-containing protein n=1 Tax=Paenibacillus ferrarius TaxID=1469647 RepID=UPI003D2C3019